MTVQEERPRTVLMLGAGGFIGATLASELTRRGWRVLRGKRPRSDTVADDVVPVDLMQAISPQS